MCSRLTAAATGFTNLSSRMSSGLRMPRGVCSQAARRPVSMKAGMQFVQGIEEPCVPEVRLTRSMDGSNGTAYFTFKNPSVFEASAEAQEITGLYLVDDEGTLKTVDVQAKFVNGNPDAIEAQYSMKSSTEWDRFMRFMERYADENGLEFSKSS